MAPHSSPEITFPMLLCIHYMPCMHTCFVRASPGRGQRDSHASVASGLEVSLPSALPPSRHPGQIPPTVTALPLIPQELSTVAIFRLSYSSRL